jgi:UDP-N-acetyl-D-mannosaminuronic acid transferase (WecB/TagA/CpsF family)
MSANVQFQKVLGIRFVLGTAQQVIDLASENGGLVVVPAAPAMCTIASDAVYREALLCADLVIPDSAYMVWSWNLLHRPRISKLSGLTYLRALLMRDELSRPGATFYVAPSRKAAELIATWLNENDIVLDPADLYVAPQYNGNAQDPALVEMIERRRPRHVILGVSGGVQEPLGLYLKRSLTYMPAIHCIGAAIGFLTGDQVYIPTWADKVGIGWLIRCVSDPKRFIPRYWRARNLFSLIARYRELLPVSEFEEGSSRRI